MNVIDLTKELIKQDSSENCIKIGDYLADVLTQEGFTVTRQPVNKSGSNIIARKGYPRVAFLCHMDTVKPSPGWTRDPFNPIAEDGRVYGLGSVDMKGGLAAAIVAARSRPDAMFILTVSEESSFDGIRAVVDSGIVLPRLIVCPEPSDMALCDEHRGALGIEVIATGRSAHAARPDEGVNAARLYEAIDGLRQRVEAEDGTLTMSFFQAGAETAPNCVPAEARALLDIRTSILLFGKGTDYIKDILSQELEAKGLILSTFNVIVDAKPLERSEQTDVVMDVMAAEGIPIKRMPFIGYTEAGILQEKLGLRCIIVGPGPAKKAHAADEYMDIESVERLVPVLETILRNPPKTEIVPAIDLRSGRCVQLVGGDFNKEKVSIPDVLDVVERFQREGARRLHVVDLDAAKGTGDNKAIIKRILSQTKVPVEVGGGVKTIKDAVGFIEAGARWVIVGSAAVKDVSFLPALADAIGKDRIIVALDYKDDTVVVDGWDSSTNLDPLTLAKQMEPYCSQFLFTCVDKEGRMQGPDISCLRRIRAAINTPIIASGGIGSMRDIDALDDIDAVVVGMALYTGAVRLDGAS